MKSDRLDVKIIHEACENLRSGRRIGGGLVEKIVESEFRGVALRRFPTHEIGGILVEFVFADVAPQEENHFADEICFRHVAIDEKSAHLLIFRVGEITDHGIGAFQKIKPVVLFVANGNGDVGRFGSAEIRNWMRCAMPSIT